MSRKNIIITLFICLFITGLTSCSKDEFTPSETKKTIATEEIDTYISEDESLLIASNFLSMNNISVASRSMGLHREQVYLDSAFTIKGGTRASKNYGYAPLYYIYNIGENNGFIIVSGDKNSYPVLAYSDEGKIDKDNIPDNMKIWLQDCKIEIRSSRYSEKKQSAAIKEELEALLSSGAGSRASYGRKIVVSPLLGKIKWNQSPYYNKYCPRNTPVGCVATATCQIMKYWSYPASGEGSHSYIHRRYGKQSFDFNYKINWDKMPEHLLRYSNEDIARLCYGVAVGLNMDFGPRGSGTMQYYVPELLQKHYKYPESVRNIYRGKYSYKEWVDIIRNELDNKRPVQYAGHGDGGGHSFVCDGYDNLGYFHINWGWGGMSDGFFRLNALDPSSLGTGGGRGGFNFHQQAVIGFCPPKDNNTGNDDRPDDETPVPDNDGDKEEYPFSYSVYGNICYIKNVQFSNFQNFSTGNKGYNLYQKARLKMTKDTEITYRFTPGFKNYFYRLYWRAWLDINGDKKFTDNELITENITNGPEELRGSFSINGGVPSKITRLRISCKFGSYPKPDEIFSYGEVEDYIINISE